MMTTVQMKSVYGWLEDIHHNDQEDHSLVTQKLQLQLNNQHQMLFAVSTQVICQMAVVLGHQLQVHPSYEGRQNGITCFIELINKASISLGIRWHLYTDNGS